MKACINVPVSILINLDLDETEVNEAVKTLDKSQEIFDFIDQLNAEIDEKIGGKTIAEIFTLTDRQASEESMPDEFTKATVGVIIGGITIQTPCNEE